MDIVNVFVSFIIKHSSITTATITLLLLLTITTTATALLLLLLPLLLLITSFQEDNLFTMSGTLTYDHTQLHSMSVVSYLQYRYVQSR